jgi:hypothetical protein
LESRDYLVNEKNREDTRFVLIGSGTALHRMKARATERRLDTWVKFAARFRAEI